MKIFQKAVLLSLLIMIVKTMAVSNQTVAIYDTMKVSKTVGSGQSMSVTVQTPGESNQTITPELIGQGTDGSREYEITYVPTAPVVYTFVLDIYGGGSGSEEYFTLTGTNTTPTATNIANVTSPMNTKVTKTFNVGDAETDNVSDLTTSATWTASGVGSGSVAVTGANAKKTINFTPAVPNKVYTITYTVSDDFATREKSFTITTTNTAPTLSQIADTSASINSTVTKSFTVSDAEIGSVSAITDTAYWSDGENGGDVAISGTGETRSLSFTPTVPGTYTITYAASDGYETTTKSFTITATNTAPTLSQISNVSMPSHFKSIKSFTVSDAETGDITEITDTAYWDDGENSGDLLISGTGSSRQISFEPFAKNKVYTITYSVSDGYLETTNSYTVTTYNSAPLINSTTDSVATEDLPFEFLVEIKDFDNDAVDVILVNELPEWLNNDPVDLVGLSSGDKILFSGEPGNDDVGSFPLQLHLLDGETVVDTQFTITITNVNDAPVITSSPIREISEDSLYRYVIVAEDVDNTTLQYATKSALPAWLTLEISNPDEVVLTGTPARSDTGTTVITLLVSDNDTTVEQSFDITVIPINNERRADSLALVAIWDSLGNPAWDNWGTADSLETWSAVSMSRRTRRISSLTLDLSKVAGNQSIPSELGQLTTLISLSILNGSSITLPEELVNLTSMYSLLLENNNLTEITFDIQQLTGLQHLYLRDNAFTEVPVVLQNHPSLSQVYMGKNQVTVIPDWVVQMPNLQAISLKGNVVTDVSESLFVYDDIVALELSDNQITTLPEELGSDMLLPSEYLALNNNRIAQLPTSFAALDTLPYMIRFFGNRLQFDDLEMMKRLYNENPIPDTLDYRVYERDFADQYDVTEKETLWVAPGDSKELTASLRGTQDKIHYKWFKNGTAITADSANSYQTLTFSSVADTDTGFYYFEATSDSVNLTITSDTFYVRYHEKLDRYNDSLALLAIWDSLGQPAWTHWGSTKPLEEWDGLTISNDRVTEWNDYANVSPVGPLAPEVGNLTALERIYNNKVNFTSLPQELENCVNLKYLYLSGTVALVFPEDSLVLPGLEDFSLRNTPVNELPLSFEKSPHLKKIYVYNVDIVSLPENIRECDLLTVLSFKSTGLTQIPDWIGELTQLEHLRLYDNAIAEIPASFANLINLKSFDFDGNQLSEFNFDLTEFYQLDYLYLCGNLFTEVPEGIKNAPVVTYIAMYENQLTSVPNWLFTNKYEEIEFYDNHITALPDSFIYLDSIFYADFSDNLIETIPEGFGLYTEYIDELYLDDNRIETIPESLGELSSISELSFYGNGIHFDDMEKLVEALDDVNAVKSVFPGQENVGDQDTLWVSEGETISLTHSVRGTRSKMTYRWLKNGATLSNSYDMDSSYSINGVTLADTGFYTVDIRNDSIASLSLRSDTIWVKLNDAPVITSDTTVLAIEDQPFSYVASATDSFQSVIYQFANLPSWLTADADSVFGTPLDGDGDTSFTVIASDGYLEDSLMVTVRVTDVPDTTVIVLDTTLSTLIKADSVETVRKLIGTAGKEDTVVTTSTFDLWLDSVVTITDSLEEGISFYRDTVFVSDTFRKESLTVVIDTLKYKPTVTVTVDSTHSIVYDTVTTIDTTVEATDTIVTTVRTENWIDSLFVKTDSLSDGVSYWFNIDTVITTGSTVIDSVTDTLNGGTVAIDVVEKRVAGETFLAYPNPVPVTNGEVFFALPETLSGTATVSIFDVVGALLDQQTVYLGEGSTIRWDLRNRSGQQVASGTYVALLKVVQDDGTVRQFRTMVGVRQ